MKIGNWDSIFDEDSYSMRYTLDVEEQIRLTSEAMRSMEDKIVRDAVVEYLRDRGWVIEPPRQITPELLTARDTPSVFAPAKGIISISRGNNDATIDMTPPQARTVAKKLVEWADWGDA